MFEKEIDRVKKRLEQQLETRQPHMPLNAILANEEIHPAYRAFFEAEVQWWLYEERAIRSSNPRFDLAVHPVRDVLKTLDELYLQHARFDHEELHATIEAAAKTRLNFLCRPRTTLKWFVFRGEPTKPLYEILLRLRYLSDHAYLLDGIRQWAMSRGADISANEILSVVEFERIIEKIDNDAILDLSQEEFVHLLEPMYEFFSDINPEVSPGTVPTEAVIIYLDDKGAVPLSQALERMLYREELRALTRTKLMEVIDVVIASIDDGSLVVPMVQQQAVQQPILADSLPAVTADEPESADDNVLLRRKEKLESLLDQDSQAKITRKIFNGDSARFDELVREMLLCPSWKEAAGVVDRYFASNDIQPESAAAMEFVQALHRSLA